MKELLQLALKLVRQGKTPLLLPWDKVPEKQTSLIMVLPLDM
jgi:hypothetical protein